MAVYICNACYHFIVSDSPPDNCPSCHSASVLGATESGKKLRLPAVRPAVQAELQAYWDTEKALAAEQTFLERAEGLSAFALSNDEYHMALILLFYFKSEPDRSTASFLNDLLPAKDSYIENMVARTMALHLYVEAKWHFTAEINRERQGAGTKDIAKIAAQTPPDSAANVLRKFRRKELDEILKGPQNLGDVRRVDLEKVILEPSTEYLRFLTEWHNSIV